MKMKELASFPNLKLAWRRITSGGNIQYKRYYRSLYNAYEVALTQNLTDLQKRLNGGTFEANHPEPIYLPKQSGLHRTLSLLGIEDQIVLQAFANLAAKKIHRKREPFQSDLIFSNLLESQNSIFFFRKWQDTYESFKNKIKKHYAAGLRWVGDFDLAAFYDTISHELLLKTIYPLSQSEDLRKFSEWLKTWSSFQKQSAHGHGLPQGPLASDFLAECFLFPIDEKMSTHRGYLRYVDDVRLIGSSEEEVRADLVELEQNCRERGLIPQAGKFSIKKARNSAEATGMLPSIADPHDDGADNPIVFRRHALQNFHSAIGGRPYRVKDKTRLRFVLYRASPDSKILELVLRLLPRHPEHADAFFSYIGGFGYRKPIESLCIDLIHRYPYAYVRGEAWHVLAKYIEFPKSATSNNQRQLTDRAIKIACERKRRSFSEIWGACHFLCISEKIFGYQNSRWLQYQQPLLQSMLAPVLPDSAYRSEGVVKFFLKRTRPEPGISVCSFLHDRRITPLQFGRSPDQLPSQVVNILRELGVITGVKRRVDAIGEILENRYGILKGKSWHDLLESEYVHALGILKQAEAAFYIGRSEWLGYMTSFCQTIFIALQKNLASIGHAGKCKIYDDKNNLINFGATLQSSGPFSKHCPEIASCFRAINARRNSLPLSHSYEKKTATQATYLGKKEQDRFVLMLRESLPHFVTFMP